ncbi:hypothetical protein J4441_04090 [Candidatus Micrarchaeota archaeon]|nr:hypothetical protein [Candidatus Micrarchaeota archaeon]
MGISFAASAASAANAQAGCSTCRLGCGVTLKLAGLPPYLKHKIEGNPATGEKGLVGMMRDFSILCLSLNAEGASASCPELQKNFTQILLAARGIVLEDKGVHPELPGIVATVLSAHANDAFTQIYERYK